MTYSSLRALLREAREQHGRATRAPWCLHVRELAGGKLRLIYPEMLYLGIQRTAYEPGPGSHFLARVGGDPWPAATSDANAAWLVAARSREPRLVALLEGALEVVEKAEAWAETRAALILHPDLLRADSKADVPRWNLNDARNLVEELSRFRALSEEALP